MTKWLKKQIKKWKKANRKNKKIFRLGVFTDEIKAAEAYDFKAVELYGSGAMTNKSLGLL